jgi:glycosyltransferase involved in cell wall biosynthesis
MSTALVSVVIPTYNYGKYVVETVENVLNQTYRNFEIIVVDDGSTDDTRERLKAYADRIRYVHQENQGCAAARNTGIQAASGEWIAFLDADDLWHPQKLEVQMAYLAKHPDIVLLAANHLEDLSGGWPAIDIDHELPAESISVEDIVTRSRFGPSCVLTRKDCFAESGAFDSSLAPGAEDRDMWIRIASLFPAAILRAPLWWYRIHGSSMSYHAENMIRSERQVLEKTFAANQLLRKNWPVRLQTFSYFHRSAACMYDTAGMHSRALGQIIWSIVVWPFPLSARVQITPLERLKILVVILLRMLGLKRPESVPP